MAAASEHKDSSGAAASTLPEVEEVLTRGVTETPSTLTPLPPLPAGKGGLPPGVVSIDSIRDRKVTVSRGAGKYITGLTVDQVMSSSYHLDSDVFTEGAAPGAVASLWTNLGNLRLNSHFEADETAAAGPTEASAASITNYLRTWGKIPSFIEIRLAAGKGYGAFTTTFLRKGLFLGQYMGLHRGVMVTGNAYNFTTVGFKGEASPMIIDAETMTFANWTRFINDGKVTNCHFLQLPYQVLVQTSVDIEAGTELLVSYGDKYWEGIGVSKID